MVHSKTSGRSELASILELAAEQDGPIRLFRPRDLELRKTCPGLFPSSRGEYGHLIEDLLDTMLEEVIRHPRMVRLTSFGLETLLRNTPQPDRPALVARVSPLYREELLQTWERFATRGEKETLEKAIEATFGHWFPHSAAEQKSELDEFRERFVQEIANSWHQAKTNEAQNRLAHLLKILGAEPLGRENEKVCFTGIHHTPLAPLFKGDPATVVRPGWVLPHSPAPILLVKADVQPANPDH